MRSNHTIDSDTWQAPPALARAHHCKRLILPRFHIHQDIDMLTVYGGLENEQSEDAASAVYG